MRPGEGGRRWKRKVNDVAEWVLTIILPRTLCHTGRIKTPNICPIPGIIIYVCMVITHSKSMDPPGKKVANPARGQLGREGAYFPVPVHT